MFEFARLRLGALIFLVLHLYHLQLSAELFVGLDQCSEPREPTLTLLSFFCQNLCGQPQKLVTAHTIEIFVIIKLIAGTQDKQSYDCNKFCPVACRFFALNINRYVDIPFDECCDELKCALKLGFVQLCGVQENRHLVDVFWCVYKGWMCGISQKENIQ